MPFQQSSQASERDLAEHEYVAYAMNPRRFRPMPVPWCRLPSRNCAFETRELNSFVAAADPFRFAAKAWTHFSAPGNGCDFVRKLTDGEVSLRLPNH